MKVKFFFLRESEAVFGNQGLQVRTLIRYVGPFCLLWMLTNYSYVRALGVIQAADVTALFSSCNAFVYIFSLIWLKESLGIIKVRLPHPPPPAYNTVRLVHFTIAFSVTWFQIETRPEVTLFQCRPHCFSNINQVVLMLIS